MKIKRDDDSHDGAHAGRQGLSDVPHDEADGRHEALSVSDFGEDSSHPPCGTPPHLVNRRREGVLRSGAPDLYTRGCA